MAIAIHVAKIWQLPTPYTPTFHASQTLRGQIFQCIKSSDGIMPIVHDPVGSSAMHCQIAVGIDGSVGRLQIHHKSQNRTCPGVLSFQVILPHISKEGKVFPILWDCCMVNELFTNIKRSEAYSATTPGLSSQEQASTKKK